MGGNLWRHGRGASAIFAGIADIDAITVSNGGAHT